MTLQTMGFPTDLEVSSVSDGTPPQLIGFDFNPKSVDVTTGSADVTCSFIVTDDLSGINYSRCSFKPPSGSPARGCFAYPPSTECSFSVPQYSEEGTWRPDLVIQDNIGNEFRPDWMTLQTMGFPTDLEVGFLVGSPIAIISTPKNGKRVRGNSLTIKAKLAEGSPDDVSSTLGVRFDFRLLPSDVFAPIPAKNANHPNPDTAYPYFTHWDVSGVPSGDYELRAIAHDLADNPDPSPQTIMITIDHGGPVDIDENLTFEGVQEKRSAVDDGAESHIGSGDWTDASTAAEVVIPPGALSFAADTAILSFPDPASEEPLLDPSAYGIGAFVAVFLESGQTEFESGATSDLIVSYNDDDHDGYVDGFGIAEDVLELRQYDAVADAYVPMPNVIVMTEHNLVIASTSSTGRFGIVPEPSVALLLSIGALCLAGLAGMKRS